MAKFTEITRASDGEKQLVNLDWVEEIQVDINGLVTIYFAFQARGVVEQDYIRVKESYAIMKLKVGIFDGSG